MSLSLSLSLSLSVSLEDQIEEALEKKRQVKVVRASYTCRSIQLYIFQCVTMMMSLQASPLVFFPWGASHPQRDESGKLQTRRRPNPPPPQSEVPLHSVYCMPHTAQSVTTLTVYIHVLQFHSIVEQFQRVGKRDALSTHCTHPFTHGGYWV